MKSIQRYTAYFSVVFFTFATMQAMNLTTPYEALLKPTWALENDWQFHFWVEKGFGDIQPHNEDGNKVNVLRILHSDQDALAMLDGFDPTSKIGQLRTRIGANNDGVRGHFCLSGNMELNYAGGIGIRHFFPHNFSLALYVPFYSQSLHNVTWSEQTKEVSADDIRVKENLTNDFFANVNMLGCGLDLCGWKRSGLGDTTLLAEWVRDFPQAKPFFKKCEA